jgi:hypothetical protein
LISRGVIVVLTFVTVGVIVQPAANTVAMATTQVRIMFSLRRRTGLATRDHGNPAAAWYG